MLIYDKINHKINQMETKQMGNLEIRVFSDMKALSEHATQIFISESKKNIARGKIFTVSISGGSTSKKLFRLLAADFKNSISWQNVHIFFGDEREKKQNPESNFQITYQIWLEKIIKEIPGFENNIHRIKMELGLVRGAKGYEKEIVQFAPEGFDLSFNGAGSDGHRNGTFPDNPNWRNKIWDLPKRVKVYGYKVPPEINPYTERITLTPWFLNKSKVNILILSGEEKANLLRKITIEKEKYTKRDLPAITFNDVPTIVLVDKLAASKL